MIKRLRLGFIVIASVMLLLLGISKQEEARAQDTCENCICPGLDNNIGWFLLGISFPDGPTLPDFADFTAGMLGTIESLGAGTSSVGGLDWLFNEDSFLNTTELGSQLVVWWSQKNGRNTFVQVTNTIGFCTDPESGEILGIPCVGVQDCPDASDIRTTCRGVDLEVKFLDENCVELTNFCENYTPGDTHVYNFGDLIGNNGTPRNDTVLQGHEGVFVVTPVDNCADEFPISWNFLQGSMRMVDQGNDIDYGANVYTRFADNNGPPTPLENCEFPGTVINDCDCHYEFIDPFLLSGDFFQLPTSVAVASDLVLISFIDNFDFVGSCDPIPYAVIPGFTAFSTDDFCDGDENCNSCPPVTGCFIRTGLNDTFVVSEDFAPPTPSPTPTPTPTITATPTPQACSQNDPTCPAGQHCDFDSGICVAGTPTPPNGGGGGGGCDIAGAPVQLGTAMANILIPLVPAFAIGYRVMRRRNRKAGK
ncbi:MAG TPA: hypothetical protein VH878_01650 [Thermodesulfobacteriota bacterium]